MAKGPFHETIQPAKTHKSVEGILKRNYKEIVSIRTEKEPDWVHVGIGRARVSPQAESTGVQRGWFYLAT